MSKVPTFTIPALCLMLVYTSIAYAGVRAGLGTPTGRGVGIQGTGVSGGTGGGIGIGNGATGPGSSQSGFNSGGSGVAGTGIGDFGRATSGSSSTAGCILENSGNMAITSCMTAGKRRILHA